MVGITHLGTAVEEEPVRGREPLPEEITGGSEQGKVGAAQTAGGITTHGLLRQAQSSQGLFDALSCCVKVPRGQKGREAWETLVWIFPELVLVGPVFTDSSVCLCQPLSCTRRR